MRKFYLLLVLMSALLGCGYSFEGAGSVLPPDVKTVAIPRVENNTTNTFITQVFTEALRERFERYGVLTVVDSVNDADAVLNVRVKSAKRSTRSVSSGTDTALQYDLVLASAGELRKLDGQLLWADPDMRVSKSYGSTGDTVVTSSADFASGSLGSSDLGGLGDLEVSRGQEQETFIQLSEDLAKKMYNAAVAPEF